MASRRPSPAEAAGRLDAGLRPLRLQRAAAAIGSVGRSAVRFSTLTGLSMSARRRELGREPGDARLSVRPPDYWAGQRRDDRAADGSVVVQRTGDAAYDALVAKRRATQARAASRPVEPRGLPATTHRRGVSLAGPLTGPGSVVRRLTPAPVATPPNPATTSGGPTTRTTPTPPSPRRSRASAARHGGRPPADDAHPARRGGELVARTVAGRHGTPQARPTIATPGFDAALGRVARATPVPPPAGVVDAGALARVAGAASTAAAVTHVPAPAERAAHPLPIAAVSVHAAAPAVARNRRLSFARSSALADRSPWDDVRRQTVGTGASPVVRRVPSSDASPGSRELRRVRGRQGVTWSDGTMAGVSRGRGLALERGMRAPVPRASATAARSADAGPTSAPQESLADAVRRVFGDPTPGSGTEKAAPRAPIGPRTADGANDTATAGAWPGALFAGTAGAGAASSRVTAAPGTVLARATTHGPLATAERERVERAARAVEVQRLAVGAPPVVPTRPAASVTPLRPRRAAATEPPERTGLAPVARLPIRARGLPGAAGDAGDAARQDLSVLAAAGRAASRDRARVTVQRLAQGARGGSILSPRRPGAPAVPAAGAARPAAASLRERVAALTSPDTAAGVAPSSDLLRRLPVGAPAAVVRAPAAATAAASTSTSTPVITSGTPTLGARSATSAVAARVPARPGARPDRTASTATSVLALRSPVTARLDALRTVRARPSTLLRSATATPEDRAASSRSGATPPRRAMRLPVAPGANATVVLPGIRSVTSGQPQRPATSASGPAGLASTADRLRDLVAAGAFDGGTVRRSPVAPPPGTPLGRDLQPKETPGTTPRTAVARFEDVLRRTPAARHDKPAPLPTRFRPLAERIVGPKVAVRLVHGSTTRAALDAAGHEAATTDATIHLRTRPDTSARTMSIVAHELEHVAAPSPVPRFHGGASSPEETRAARTEQVVRRLAKQVDARGGPSGPGTAGLPVGGVTAFGRSGSAATPSPSTSSSTSSGPPVPASAIQRAPGTASSSAGSTADDDTSPPIRREVITTPELDSSRSSDAPALSPSQLSAIIRAVEDRLIEEIERRGGIRRGAF